MTMHVRQLVYDEVRVFAVVFETGDEPIQGLVRFARDFGIDAAHLTGIGAFRHARLGWFDPDAREYRHNEVRAQSEVVSLVGDITLAGPDSDGPMVHAHAVLGLADGRALGGHLLEATVRPTLEVMVTETPAALRRRHDPATGLALIDLGRLREGEAVATHGESHGQDRR